MRPALAFVAAMTLAIGPAFADRFIPAGGGWQTYISDRYGERCDYPADIFTPKAPPENGDGRTFGAKDTTTLQVYAYLNAAHDTPASLKLETVGGEGYEHVTYSPSGSDWMVISGVRGDRIYYEKYWFSDALISVFAIEYPAGEKARYAPIVERIAKSFKAGHSD